MGSKGTATIRTNYDPEADVLYVAFGAPGVRFDTSEEVAARVFLGLDANGGPIGVEAISVRRRASGLATMEATAG